MRRPTLPALLAVVFLASAIGVAAAKPHSAGASSRFASASTAVYPDDPGFRYTEYARATVTHTAAVFDRPGVPNGNGIASPGTRVNFRTDATRISIVVTYTFACNATGCGHFAVERDGRLLPQIFGSDTIAGTATYLIATQPVAAMRSYSVIWPYGTQMVFDGLLLDGGQHRLVSPAPTRPARRWVAYGDSITQGYYATNTTHTYPHQVAERKNWSVVNMGFGGEPTVPTDGTAVGLLNGGIVTVAIGTNDWGQNKAMDTFVSDYNGLLDAIRSLQPNVPLYCVTPIWTSVEGFPNSQGLTLQNYRQAITNIVQARMTTDPNLHLVDGLTLVPHLLKYFQDGVHPNDAGFALYAQNLAAKLS
ncbi:MAG TPA: GDSL-type esterase/lipase family protein [Gaiellaceae bacterium]|nr:GDSL-type esterase/lipase family protein [Gaiellaceae bacterium]